MEERAEATTWNHAPGLVAVPCQEVVWTTAFMALHRMILRAPSGSKEFFIDHPYPVPFKRDQIAHRLLEEENDDLRWVLMIDADMIPPEHTIARLLEALHEFDIVGGLCFARRPPHPVCAGSREAYLSLASAVGPVVEVDWVGTGCVMFRREVFERLDPPWFQPDPDGKREDVNFMLRASTYGLRIACAVDLPVGHLTLTNVDREFAMHCRASEMWGSVRPI